jgi:hypothetical protein
MTLRVVVRIRNGGLSCPAFKLMWITWHILHTVLHLPLQTLDIIACELNDHLCKKKHGRTWQNRSRWFNSISLFTHTLLLLSLTVSTSYIFFGATILHNTTSTLILKLFKLVNCWGKNLIFHDWHHNFWAVGFIWLASIMAIVWRYL